MKIIWKMNGQEYGLGLGRNDDCPCGSHIKFKYCCIDDPEKCGILALQGKRHLVLSKRLIARKVKKLARAKKFRRVALATKRYNAKMKRRSYNEVHTN